MTTLPETLDSTREEMITKHYDAAVAELKNAVSQSPFQTTFYLWSGCNAGKDVADEVVLRLNKNNAKATLNKTLLTRKLYITVETKLPEHLDRTPKKEEAKPVEEKKAEAVNVEAKAAEAEANAAPKTA